MLGTGTSFGGPSLYEASAFFVTGDAVSWHQAYSSAVVALSASGQWDTTFASRPRGHLTCGHSRNPTSDGDSSRVHERGTRHSSGLRWSAAMGLQLEITKANDTIVSSSETCAPMVETNRQSAPRNVPAPSSATAPPIHGRLRSRVGSSPRVSDGIRQVGPGTKPAPHQCAGIVISISSNTTLSKPTQGQGFTGGN